MEYWAEQGGAAVQAVGSEVGVGENDDGENRSITESGFANTPDQTSDKRRRTRRRRGGGGGGEEKKLRLRWLEMPKR